MAKPFTDWTVLPHGKLTQVEENLLTVTGLLKMPLMGDVVRRMTVARLLDGRLVIYSAIAMDEAQMSVLEQFGAPAYLLVPNDLHRMDIAGWKRRYPNLKVIAPKGAAKRVEALIPVDATHVELGDPSVSVLSVPGTADKELALVVMSRSGTTIVLNDLIFDLANRHGVSGWFFKAIGMTGDEPHIAPVVKMREVKDEKAVCAQLEAWARIPTLKRVIISHGNIIEDGPAQVLRRIAGDVAA